VSYLPELRDALVQAADRARALEGAGVAEPLGAGGEERARAGWRERAGAGRRSSRWRWTAVNVAIGLAGTVIGLGAAGVFHRGTALGPELPPSPETADGVAIPSSVELLPLRVADPSGGPPWGIRVVRTTRGLTCVDVGRVDFNTIGVLGQDGAFGDDGRFHPISVNVFEGLGCDTTDARGNGFVNVALQDARASSLSEGPPSAGGCVVREEFSRVERRFLAQSRGSSPHRPAPPACPQGDIREIYFGLLGPDARSITYRDPGGGLRTIPTSGPQGAYLLVFPQATKGCLAPTPIEPHGAPHCPYGGRGNRGGPDLESGVISAVTYRDGHTCHVPPPGIEASLFGHCPPVGFVSPPRQRFTTAQLATPIAVQELPARSYCSGGVTVEPCDAGVPAGFTRIREAQHSLLVYIGFTSRVAIPDSRSYYEIELSFPHRHGCGSGGAGVPTDSDIRAGERVRKWTFVPYSCAGRVHGSVSYIPTEGAATSMPVTGLPGQGKPALVARFSFTVAAR
jgi:hypothetical protein